VKPQKKVLEQRRHPRLPLGTKGWLHFPDERKLEGVFLDISYGGVKIEVSRSIEPRFLVGQAVRVEVPMLTEQSAGRLGKLLATVRWARARDNGRLWLGLQFSDATSASLRLVVPNLGKLPR